MARIDGSVEAALVHPGVGQFSESELNGVPDPVRRYFQTSIAPNTPLAQTARIHMRGQIKVGRWLPYRAVELLTPHFGFEWAARAAGIISGSDRFIDGHGAMKWKLGGLFTVMTAEGPDVSRSAAERAGAEAVWIPTSLLPRFGVEWTAEENNRITARFYVGEHPLEVTYMLNRDNLVESVVFQRWGDPSNEGTFALHTFGGTFSSHREFAGLTIPTTGRLGWHYGTDQWSEGEFFRFRITNLESADRTVDG